jgi:hypothetical protein
MGGSFTPYGLRLVDMVGRSRECIEFEVEDMYQCGMPLVGLRMMAWRERYLTQVVGLAIAARGSNEL